MTFNRDNLKFPYLFNCFQMAFGKEKEAIRLDPVERKHRRWSSQTLD